MQDPAVRDLIWKAYFEADVRFRYFGALAGKLKSWERRLALVVAIGSSSAFITLLAKIPHAPVVLSGIVAVAGAILASQKYERSAALSAELGRRWGDIKREYGVLWMEVDDLKKSLVLKRHREIEEKHVSPADEIAMREFKVHSKLLAECQRQARRAGGFEKAA